jgi:hypothetical protein
MRRYTLVKSTCEVNIAMLKLGAKLAGMGRGEADQALNNLTGKGLHSSTFQLNLSRFWHKLHP